MKIEVGVEVEVGVGVEGWSWKSSQSMMEHMVEVEVGSSTSRTEHRIELPSHFFF